MPKIILASSSAWRKQVLQSLGVNFEVVVSELDEEPYKKNATSPEKLVIQLAELKAQKAVKKLSSKYKKYLLITADSLAYLRKGKNWQLFDKPKNRGQAREMLMTLRGKSHYFITGLVVENEKGKRQEAICISKVTFKNFANQTLEAFLASGGWREKAGGYDILHQELVAGYTGSYSNICGLPVEKLLPILQSFGIRMAELCGSF